MICPFHQPYDEYHEKIYSPAIQEADRQPRRADDIFKSGNVVHQIYEAIAEAEIILVELSELNANVYYELGIAHALGKPCILLTSDPSRIPFDLRSQRHVVYDPQRPEWAEVLRSDIIRSLRETEAEPVSAVLLSMQLAAADANNLNLGDPGAVRSALGLLQASVDSLRAEVHTVGDEEPAIDAPWTAAELRAMAEELLAGHTPEPAVVTQLRRRGAPTAWARNVVRDVVGQRKAGGDPA